MEEYTTFCDDELKDKGYAIETAATSIEQLTATVADASAQATELDDEIAELGTTLSAKGKVLLEAQEVRKGQNEDFQAAEKELLKTIDELSRAATVLKRGMSFAQGSGMQKKLDAAVQALKGIVDAAWLDWSSRRSLRSFLQQANAAKDTDDDDL